MHLPAVALAKEGAPNLVKYTPQNVTFVDDRKNNVESVDKALATRGLDCMCVRYGAADHQYKTFNPVVADTQMKYLDRPIPDSAARAIVQLGR